MFCWGLGFFGGFYFRGGGLDGGWWRRHILIAGGANLQEVVEGAGILAIQGDLVTVEEMERVRGIGQALERERGDSERTANGRVVLHGLQFKQSGVHDPVTRKLPACYRHGFDERGLTGGARLKFIDQRVHQLVEKRGAFGPQHDAAGELVVAAGVLGGSLLAFFGDGSGGPFCVGAVGLDLTFGSIVLGRRTGPL